jgi:periplasmic divalent cation tolerance protein
VSTDVLVILCTCPDAAAAGAIAETLVREGLAACVNTVPGIASVYLWQGQIQRDAEVLLLIKSTQGRLAQLTERLREIHPYELPEIVALPVGGGLPDYLQWVTKCTLRDD